MTVKTWDQYNWKDGVRIGTGLVMLLLGLIGLVLPILQGALFLIVSAVLLGPYSLTVQRIQAWSERKFPETHRRAHRLGARLARRR